MATETITLRLVAQDLMSGNVSKAISGLDKLSRQGGLLGWTLKGVGISMGNMLNPAALVASGIGAITDAAGAAISAASDLAEQSSKVGEVFDEQADQVRDWAASLDSSFGITERQALTTAGTLGNLFDAMGLGTTETREMSTALTELAGDLSSFNNADIKEVLVALQSGIVGETEPMRRFGVDLSAAAVNAKALALGLKATAGALTQSDKVQARYALIMEKTSSAQGDAARTAETLAGKQRQMNAMMGDLQTKVGALLIGPASGFLGFLSGVVDILDGPNGATAELRDLSKQVYAVHQAAASGGGESPIARMNKEMQAWADTLKLQEANGTPESFQWLERLGPDTLRNFGPATAEALADVRSMAQAYIDMKLPFSEFAMVIRQQVAPAYNVLTGAWTGGLAEIEEVTTTTLRRTAENVRGIAWNIPMGVADALRDGKKEVRGAMRDLIWVMEHPWAGAKKRAFILAKLTSQRLIDGINSKNPDVRQAAIDARAALLTQWNALPGKAMELGRLTIQGLVRGLSEGEQYALGLYGQTGTDSGDAQVRRNRRRGRRGRRAGGGHVMGGESYIVGEDGPEELHLGAGMGGYVTPNHQMGGGGTVIINLNGLVMAPSESELDRIARKLAPGLRRAGARSGA